MSDMPHWQDVLTELRKIIRATDLQSKRMSKSCGLTIPQVMVMRSIDLLGDVTVKCLSAEISLSQATVTTILNRLESRLMIERIRSKTDRRIVNARLTDFGKEVLAKVPPLLHEAFIEKFERLEVEAQTSMLASLSQIASMMNAEDIDAAPLLDIAVPDKNMD